MICQIKLTNVCSSLPILCLEYVMLASNTRSAYVSKTEYTIPLRHLHYAIYELITYQCLFQD